ncbi:MAG: HD domain-containing protein [Anaerolineaceae bacterium]|nr:HD domain-containing protein [Anaerolineaceae bacterium]
MKSFSMPVFLRRKEPQWPRQPWLKAALVAGLFWLISILIVAYPAIVPGFDHLAELSEGDLAPRDIVAPRDSQFVSQIRTEEQRQAAADAVQPIYDAPDPEIARIQTARAQKIFAFIEDLRQDSYASLEQKIADLQTISDLSLSDETSIGLLALEPERWAQVQLQIVSVLEWVMRDSIREMDLPLIQRERVPLAVSLTFSAEEAAIIVDIASDLVRFNTRENSELTEEMRHAAAADIAPVTRSFISGERIVSAQQRVDALQWEALNELGLTQLQDTRWQVILQAALASAFVVFLAAVYLWRWPGTQLRENGSLLVALVGTILLFTLVARFVAGEGRLFAFPTAAIALVFVGILGMEGVFLSLLPLALLLTIMTQGSIVIGVMFLAGGLAGAFYLRRSARLSEYFLVSIVIAAVNVIVLGMFQISLGEGLLSERTLIFAGLNGILAAFVALASLYLLTTVFNQPTSLKLIELARPNHPLLQRLLREAPGTYTHSLQVANLAEQAAQAIGADAELTHVASMYHDIGKVLHPSFYIENQAEMGNPHDALADPFRSADILIDHVREGEKLAREAHLPARFRDFILEHHGTTLNEYFYRRACEQHSVAEVEEAAFRYPGPRPRSRETAILMLADSCEAATRARNPHSRQEVTAIVQEIFQARRDDRQLDRSPLTLRELRQIEEIFVDMLQAIFHPRIDYRPSQPEEQEEESAAVPEVIVPTPAAEGAEAVNGMEEEEDAPLAEVPPLRRSQKATPTPSEGQSPEESRSDDDPSA